MEYEIIETGIDKLILIVKERGRIALEDAAKELGVSAAVIQGWVNFFDDNGAIDIEYSLTKPYLVERKLTRKEIESKAKEFAIKKDMFVRKAEVNLLSLEKQASELKKIKGEFDKLKSELGLEFDTIRLELKELERYAQLSEDLRKKSEEQSDKYSTKIRELSNQILREEHGYNGLIEKISARKEELKKEKTEVKSVEEDLEALNKNLSAMKTAIKFLEREAADKKAATKSFELGIDALIQKAEELMQHFENEKSIRALSLKKIQEETQKNLMLQETITKNIVRSSKNVSNAKYTAEKVNNFFYNKLYIFDLVDKINTERDNFEKELTELIKKAGAFRLSPENDRMGQHIIDLEEGFYQMDKKKGIFEESFRKLLSILTIKK